MEALRLLIQRLSGMIDQYFPWLIVAAWIGVILFAPHDGNVGGWLFKWVAIAAAAAITLTLGLAVFAGVAGFIGRLLRW
ncbi:MAG: hypothetical protein WC383_14315 [Gammaproteobacteria bacterium]|jgi:hypothetical protein